MGCPTAHTAPGHSLAAKVSEAQGDNGVSFPAKKHPPCIVPWQATLC